MTRGHANLYESAVPRMDVDLDLTSSSRPKRAGTSIWFPALFAAISGLLLLSGLTVALTETYRLVTYQPVPARVQFHAVREITGKNTEYVPIISYVYSVEGTTYRSNQVYPNGNRRLPEDLASQVISRYPVGAQTTAWYSPSDPRRAFLIHETEWFTFSICIILAVMFVAGLAGVVEGVRSGRRPAVPIPVGNGSYRISEEGTIGGRFRSMAIASIVWYGFSTILVGSYFLSNNRQVDLFVLIAGIVSAALGLLVLLPMARNWRLHHDFLDADVRISQPVVCVGNELQIQIRQDVRRSLEVQEFAMGLVCLREDFRQGVRGGRYTTKEQWSQWKQLAANCTFAPGFHMEGQAKISLPLDNAPSSPPGGFYPVFSWQIKLRISAAGEPQLEANFPIIVQPAHRASII